MFGRTCRQQSSNIRNLKVKPISGNLDKPPPRKSRGEKGLRELGSPKRTEVSIFVGLVLPTEGSTVAHFYGMICGSGFASNYGGGGTATSESRGGRGSFHRLVSIKIGVATV